MNLVIDIIFGSDPGLLDEINFKIARVSNPTVKRDRLIKFVDSATLTGEVSIPDPTGTPGEASAIAYAAAWSLYYSSRDKLALVGIITVTTVRITYINNLTLGCYLQASDFTSDDVGVTHLFINCSASTLTLTEVLFGAATVPCDDVEISIETSALAPEIYITTGDGSEVQLESSNAANPYLVDVGRGVDHFFRLVDAGANELIVPVLAIPFNPYLFPSFGVAQITVNINPSLAGATLEVKVLVEKGNPIITFTYSIDDAVYQSSNIFTGQPDGAGTMYVLDGWGCKQSIPYNVTDAGTRDPFLFISKANSINFAEFEVWDDCTIFKNDDNLLAHQGLEDVVYCETMLWQTCDIIRFQFKSNYDTPTCVLRHEDLSPDTNLSVQKMSSNLSRFQSMDCWYYKFAEGLLGLYFESGDTYDESDVVIPGGEFSLLGNLPDFAIKGQFVDINGLGVFRIVDIVFDTSIIKKAIIVEFTYNGVPVSTRVKSTFDLLPYEIFEIEIDWNIHGIGLYDILLTNTDTIHTTVEHLSENISIEVNHPQTLAIQYYNNNNRDVFYKYGIKHFMRISYLHIEGVPLDDTDINITDLSTEVTDSTVHEADKIFFDEMVKARMRTLAIALSSENLFIQGLGYAKNASMESENIGRTNLYSVIAELIRTNININTNRQGQQGLDEDTIEFDIPSFILGDGGFIKS